MIGHRSFLDQSVTFENIREVTIGQGDDYRTGLVQDCPYFKANQNLIAIELSRTQTLDADSEVIQNLISMEIFTMQKNNNAFIFEELKEISSISYSKCMANLILI